MMFRSSVVFLAAVMATGMAQAQDEDMSPTAAEPATPSKPAETVSVALDLAAVIKIPEGTETLALGNPSIADVTRPRAGG